MSGVNGVTLQNNNLILKVAPNSNNVDLTNDSSLNGGELDASNLNNEQLTESVVVEDNEQLTESVEVVIDNEQLTESVEVEETLQTETEEETLNKEEKPSIKVDEKTDKIEEKSNKISVVKTCFSNIENVLLSLYTSVFDKNSNFNVRYNQVISDLVSYIGVKSAKLGVFAKFRVEFLASEGVLNSAVSDDNYVPLAIKLTAMIDKQAKSSCAKAVINELVKIFYGLLKGNDLVATLIANELSAIYTYALTMGLNLS